MATYWLEEYEDIPESARNSAHSIQIPELPITVQSSAFTTSEQSAAFNVLTNYICVQADATFHVAFGTNPTATVASARVPADTIRFWAVPKNQAYKIAVYDGSS